jgi:hypothetical protein
MFIRFILKDLIISISPGYKSCILIISTYFCDTYRWDISCIIIICIRTIGFTYAYNDDDDDYLGMKTVWKKVHITSSVYMSHVKHINPANMA